IVLWTYLFNSSLSATEVPEAETSASALPRSLKPTIDSIPGSAGAPYYLITQSRQGDLDARTNSSRQEFTIPVEGDFQPGIPVGEIEVIEVIADRQEYDRSQGTILATGNVLMSFAQSTMTSERLEINLNNRLAVATGNVVLKRGEQVLRGERFEYNLVADRGVIIGAGGEIYQPSLGQDTDFKQRLLSESNISDRALSDRLINNQPITNVTADEGLGLSLGSRGIDLVGQEDFSGGSTIKRLRFEADRLEFETSNWTAENLRLTNDPFSPPELELRAATATFQQLESNISKLNTTKSGLVIDDSLRIPLLVSAFAFDSRPGRPGLFNIAFDGDERGGLYIERTWSLFAGEKFSWKFTPQYFLQRALIPATFGFSDDDEGGLFNSAVFGLTTRIQADFSRRSSLNANASLTGVDLANSEDSLRSKIEFQNRLGNLENPFRLALEYNYRDRLFNGSLGFQTVRESIGGVITSPQIKLGNTGVNLNLQGSIKKINDDTDRADLLETVRENDRIGLTRYQAAAFASKSFSLWTGKALPSTKNEGLRYTPIPVVPYLNLFTKISGVSSLYSNSDSQLSLEGKVGIEGQIGHFSRSWLDYTGFKISYSQNLRGDESPFLFDRLVDRQTLSVDITQQIYGPIRVGYQTAIDLRDRDTISSDYILEYSRRTHNVVLRYNPVLEIGSLSLRVSDFNWQGNSEPFSREDITPVVQGVD
ncbi:MAG: DUF3769 domain-containing protein, partial [Cyanobacteria bacterium J06600_6]